VKELGWEVLMYPPYSLVTIYKYRCKVIHYTVDALKLPS